MINFIKSLFHKKHHENSIAAKIEFKEAPASTWWK